MKANSRRGVLPTLIIGTMMAALDSSIVNISLPAMTRTLGARIDEIGWVVGAYLIAFAVIMPTAQWLKDRWGFFWVYFASLAIFTLGSLLCGIAPTLPWLVGARILQGLGGGALTPTALAVLSTIYPPRERGRVLGLWGLGVVTGPSLGPTLGGILTQHFGWPSIFLINLPFAAVGLVMTWRYLRPLKFPRPKAAPFDWPGFLFLSGFLSSLLYGITGLESAEVSFTQHLIWFAASAVLFVGFLVTETRRKAPLIDLKVFRIGELVASLAVTFARTAGLYGGVFLLPFLLQGLLGYTESAAGLLMIPGAGLVAVLMPFAGRWADRHGPRGIILVGLSLVVLSLALFACLGIGSGTAAILAVMSLRGIGLGLLLTPLSVATVNSVHFRDLALASSLSSLFQQVGGAVGVAVLSVLLQSSKGRMVAAGVPEQLAQQSALRLSFGAAAACMALALIPALFIPRRAPTATSEEVLTIEA